MIKFCLFFLLFFLLILHLKLIHTSQVKNIKKIPVGTGFPHDCLHNGNSPYTTAYTIGIPHTVLSMAVTSCSKYSTVALCHMLNIDY